MSNSFRKTIRFNYEYDKEIIDKMKKYTDRSLSKLLRKFIRDGFNSMSDTLTQSNNEMSDKTIKWNFPK